MKHLVRFRDCEGPAAGCSERGHVVSGDGIVRHQHYGVVVTHCPRRAQNGPGAFKAARIDYRQTVAIAGHGRRYLSLSNGLRALRSVRRTGTAPNPSSRRMPFTR